MNLFYEARQQSSLGQRWVLDVVRKRVTSSRWPDTHCGVIKQHKQFSWYLGKLKEKFECIDPLYWNKAILERYKDIPLEKKAWLKAVRLAGGHYFFKSIPEFVPHQSTHYMTKQLYRKDKTCWLKDANVSGIIGDHVFFDKVNETENCNV